MTKEITLKVVYYGPGLSGKTTNLQYLYSVLDASSRGKFISLATESDRTLFFDFLPVELGKIKDFSVRFQLYTVPGQIRYNATRKLVLKGADAVVFVADSQRDMREQNIESLSNMRENLLSNNLNPDDIPVVFQYNKRDLPNILSPEELDHDLNDRNYKRIEAVALSGKGVQETFHLITRLLLKDIAQKHKVDIAPPREAIAEGVTVKLPEKERLETVELAEPGTVLSKRPPKEEIPAARSQASLTAAPAASSYMEESLNSLMTSVGEINRSLTGIKETLSVIYNEVKESGRHQSEAMKLFREVYATMAQLKRKRRWYHFFSG